MKLEYLDHRYIFIHLKAYPGGIGLPSGDNIIEVTRGEARSLLKRKNGDVKCFKEIKMEVDDGSR